MAIAKKLKYGDKIGIISPSHVAERERYAKIFIGIRAAGFDIIEGKNLYKDSYGYIASEQERADDFGHGMNHGILPIGQRAVLDAEKKILEYV